MSTLPRRPGAPVWTPETIRDELQRRITGREVTTADTLVETALASEFGVSRTPVREALAAMVDLGVLERTARGYLLRRWTAEQMLDLYQVRIALESEAAALAADRHLPLDIAKLKHLLQQAQEASEPAEVVTSNGRWHLTLRQAAHNAALDALQERVSLQLRVAEGNLGDPRALPPHDAESNALEHTAIIEALIARDAEAARLAMRVHLSRVRDLRMYELASHG